MEFAGGNFPVLNYNGLSQNIPANFYSLEWEGELSSDFGDGYGYLRGFQWDLRSISEPITSFEITWSNNNHAQIYALQLDQSDIFTQVIPEPSSYFLMTFGLACLFAITRIRQRRA